MAELEEDYFLRHSDDEVVRQASAIVNHQSDGEVVVHIHQYSARGATEIFIYCNDRNYLFAHITSALSKLGLTVGTRIITSRKGHALDTFLVLVRTAARSAIRPSANRWRTSWPWH